MKILFRGGSISAGKGLDHSYVDLIKKKIPYDDVTVVNRSRAGDTTFDCIETFSSDISSEKPDVLLFHFAIDDIYFPVYRSEFKENFVQVIRLARKTLKVHIILLTSHPFENQYDMDSANIYYRTIREVAVDMDCEFVPINTIWHGFLTANKKSISEYVQEDDRLPNLKGNELYAEAVLRRLKNYLDKQFIRQKVSAIKNI